MPVQIQIVAKTIPAWGLARLIEATRPRMEVAALCHSLDQAIEEAARIKVDVIVLDIDFFNEADPVTALRRHTNSRILVMTGNQDPASRDRAILSGARGVIDKGETPEVLLSAIERVHTGEMWIDAQATTRILSSLTAGTAPAHPERARIASLTTRERQTITALANNAGATGKDLAQALHISEHTLRNRLTSIYAKLGLSNRVDLFAYAQRHGLQA